MSSLKEALIRAFIDANHLEAKPVFGIGVVYHGSIFDRLLTAEQIQETYEFAGFCDGYQGKPNRHEGERGSKKVDIANKIGELMQGSLLKVEKRIRPVLGEMIRGINLDIEKVIAQTPEGRYGVQYQMGKKARSG